MRIVEIFRSLQGEGVLIGTPTVFIRTAGCNLQCRWCDTAYAWKGGIDMTIEDVARKSLSSNTEHVCLTGGEPLLQTQTPALIDLLVDEGRYVTVETNGSLDISGVLKGERVMVSMDIKCPSSGMADMMEMGNLERIRTEDQLKFVVADMRDMEYAEGILAEHDVGCQVVFSPVGGVDLRTLAEWVLSRNLNVRVLPQLHKLIWGDKRGV